MEDYRVIKDWKHNGLRCVVLMCREDHHCGYVGVGKDHPLYGLEYNNPIPKELKRLFEEAKERPFGKRGIIDLICLDINNPSVGILFDVHGGITFSSRGNEGDNKYPVESDLWWFGYDCAHAGDKCLNMPSFTDDVWRDEEYCVNECNSLADQLIEIANFNNPVNHIYNKGKN